MPKLDAKIRQNDKIRLNSSKRQNSPEFAITLIYIYSGASIMAFRHNLWRILAFRQN